MKTTIPFLFGRETEKNKNRAACRSESPPVNRAVKKYKVFPASSQVLLAAFYAVRHNSCFSMGVNTPKLRCTLMVL